MLLIPFAYSKALGRYVCPDEVDQGLKCECICTECGKALIAKQGETLRWHFAHQSDSGCGGEGMVHKLAKECLKESVTKFMRFPHDKERDPDSKYTLAKIESVKIEVWMQRANRRVDAGVLFGIYEKESDLWTLVTHFKAVIEICVTNPKDKSYISDMSNYSIPVLEMRLNQEEILRRAINQLSKSADPVKSSMKIHLLNAWKSSCKKEWIIRNGLPSLFRNCI